MARQICGTTLVALSEENRRKLEEIFAREFNVTAKDLVPQASLWDDLLLYALDITGLAEALEENFGINVPDATAESWQTYGDVLDYVDRHTK